MPATRTQKALRHAFVRRLAPWFIFACFYSFVCLLFSASWVEWLIFAKSASSGDVPTISLLAHFKSNLHSCCQWKVYMDFLQNNLIPIIGYFSFISVFPLFYFSKTRYWGGITKPGNRVKEFVSNLLQSGFFGLIYFFIFYQLFFNSSELSSTLSPTIAQLGTKLWSLPLAISIYRFYTILASNGNHKMKVNLPLHPQSFVKEIGKMFITHVGASLQDIVVLVVVLYGIKALLLTSTIPWLDLLQYINSATLTSSTTLSGSLDIGGSTSPVKSAIKGLNSRIQVWNSQYLDNQSIALAVLAFAHLSILVPFLLDLLLYYLVYPYDFSKISSQEEDKSIRGEALLVDSLSYKLDDIYSQLRIIPLHQYLMEHTALNKSKVNYYSDNYHTVYTNATTQGTSSSSSGPVGHGVLGVHRGISSVPGATSTANNSNGIISISKAMVQYYSHYRTKYWNALKRQMSLPFYSQTNGLGASNMMGSIPSGVRISPVSSYSHVASASCYLTISPTGLNHPATAPTYPFYYYFPVLSYFGASCTTPLFNLPQEDEAGPLSTSTSPVGVIPASGSSSTTGYSLFGRIEAWFHSFLSSYFRCHAIHDLNRLARESLARRSYFYNEYWEKYLEVFLMNITSLNLQIDLFHEYLKSQPFSPLAHCIPLPISLHQNRGITDVGEDEAPTAVGDSYHFSRSLRTRGRGSSVDTSSASSDSPPSSFVSLHTLPNSRIGLGRSSEETRGSRGHFSERDRGDREKAPRIDPFPSSSSRSSFDGINDGRGRSRSSSSYSADGSISPLVGGIGAAGSGPLIHRFFGLTYLTDLFHSTVSFLLSAIYSFFYHYILAPLFLSPFLLDPWNKYIERIPSRGEMGFPHLSSGGATAGFGGMGIGGKYFKNYGGKKEISRIGLEYISSDLISPILSQMIINHIESMGLFLHAALKEDGKALLTMHSIPLILSALIQFDISLSQLVNLVNSYFTITLVGVNSAVVNVPTSSSHTNATTRTNTTNDTDGAASMDNTFSAHTSSYGEGSNGLGGGYTRIRYKTASFGRNVAEEKIAHILAIARANKEVLLRILRDYSDILANINPHEYYSVEIIDRIESYRKELYSR